MISRGTLAGCEGRLRKCHIWFYRNGFLSVIRRLVLPFYFEPARHTLIPLEHDNFLSCYGCDRLAGHEVRYRSDAEFTGKLLVCQDCCETVKQPLGGPGCDDC